ncbi:hypothetical protein NEOLEDRAFT_622343 [Neolentinus lepideus HHB14362 ss-1]|uniref:Uncharacterized protein n=1 Tax=Neolentinus lepideus HHB14362 ss-1 TaxID=1314782 RepID=A0A165QT64_9AGAM|nr:hypothetical protein NEOLEDRAFT_622343 [Neolentinus lepideus HHB14362 ss-1]
MARRGFCWTILGFLPFSSYPVSRDFKHRTTVAFLTVAAILVYTSLTIWNILTQGQNKTYTSVLLTTYVNNATVACTARSINVGDTLFSYGSSVFKWSVTDIETPGGDGTGFGYSGALLQTNATFVSLLYSFAGQSYTYEVCTNASVPSLGAVSVSNSTKKAVSADARPTIVSLCSTFDPTRDVQSNWSKSGQGIISDKIYGIAAYLQDLNFANGTFPQVLFPPYGQSSATPPSDTSISPAIAYDLSMWLDEFSYLPINATFDSTVNGGFGATHPIILSDHSDQTTIDIQTLFEETAPNNVSGLMLDVNGIGGVRLQTAKTNAALGFAEPDAITLMRNYTLSTLNLILDLASSDLQNRALMSSYLCTVTSKEWKSPLSMISMLLGNNAALFGFIVGLLVAGAQLVEERRHGRGACACCSSAYKVVNLMTCRCHCRRRREGGHAGGRGRQVLVVLLQGA